MGWIPSKQAGSQIQRFRICIKEHSGDPIFQVTNPTGIVFEAKNPTKALNDAGLSKGNSSGPNFGLHHDLISRLKQAQCYVCQKGGMVEADLQRYVYISPCLSVRMLVWIVYDGQYFGNTLDITR